jgi:hypothetical protein
MATLSDAEKKELLDLAASAELREDMRLLRHNRHKLLREDGQVDVDKWIEFLTQYNAFINHEPRPFALMIERDMKM